MAQPEGSKPPNSEVLPDGGPSQTKETRNAFTQRRIFIGPMPERIIAQTENQRKRNKLTLGSVFSLSLDGADKANHTGDKSDEIARLLKEHAFTFFVHEGGNAEDWRDDDDEQDMTEELLRRWKESEWGQLWTSRHRKKGDPQHTASSNQWFGTSFEVGNLMGVNILQGHDHVNVKSALSIAGSRTNVVSAPGTVTTAQFVTAQTTLPTADSNASHINIEVTATADSPKTVEEEPTPASSRTGLLPQQNDLTHSEQPGFLNDRPKAKSEIHLRPSIQQDVSKLSTRTDAELRAKIKGKAKVHYADATEVLVPTSGPCPPQEVLERTPSTVDPNTSMAATIPFDSLSRSPSPSELQWGDVVLRGNYTISYPTRRLN